MKKCTTCGEVKSLSEFNKKSANPDGLERYCRDCHRVRNRAHYGRNAQAYKDSALKYQRNLKDWYQQYKTTQSCSRCGDDKPWRLSFHHVESSTKMSEVSTLVMNNVSREAIMEEINKCVVVCHNCHADIHHEMNNGLLV